MTVSIKSQIHAARFCAGVLKKYTFGGMRQGEQTLMVKHIRAAIKTLELVEAHQDAIRDLVAKKKRERRQS